MVESFEYQAESGRVYRFQPVWSVDVNPFDPDQSCQHTVKLQSAKSTQGWRAANEQLELRLAPLPPPPQPPLRRVRGARQEEEAGDLPQQHLERAQLSELRRVGEEHRREAEERDGCREVDARPVGEGTKMNKLGYLVRDLKRSAEEAGLGNGATPPPAAAEPPAEAAGGEPPLTPVTPVNASATPA